MLHIIWYIIVGFIVGLIARAIMPGAEHLGFIMTTLLGIAGSIIGGLIARLFSKPEPGATFHPAGFILSPKGSAVWATDAHTNMTIPLRMPIRRIFISRLFRLLTNASQHLDKRFLLRLNRAR